MQTTAGMPESVIKMGRPDHGLAQLPERAQYDGVSCRPTTVAKSSAVHSRWLDFRCGLDLKRDRARERFGTCLWRGVGLGNKICNLTHLPRLHLGIPFVRQWHEPVPIVRPIFMVGSPRSGTTILGKVFGHQGDLLFLSEARPIWYRAVPEFDESQFHWEGDRLWGRIYMDENDVTAESRAVLEEDFGRTMRLAGRRRLMEKMPINLFRVRWLNAMWPDARFIQIMRDPFGTTSSKTQCWPSIDEKELPGVAIRRRMFEKLYPHLKPLLDSVKSSYEWYLFEWRLFTEEGERLRQLYPDRYTIVRLEDAQQNPKETIEKACQFLELRMTSRIRRAYRAWLDPKVRLAKPLLDPARCRELLGESADRWGYAF